MPYCAAGAAFGSMSGVLQFLVLRSKPAAFARAERLLDVRRALARSTTGKISIALNYVCAVVLLGMVLRSDTKSLMSLASWLAGYWSFMLLRDAVAYPALKRVATEAAADAISQ